MIQYLYQLIQYIFLRGMYHVTSIKQIHYLDTLFNQYKCNGLIIFDGVCNLCNISMKIIHKYNDTFSIKMGWAQDNTVINPLINILGIEKESALNNFVYIHWKMINNERIYTVYRGSTAWIYIAKELRFPLNLIQLIVIIPYFIRQNIYKFIGKNRYKWFGKYCDKPSKSLKQRIIHSIK